MLIRFSVANFKSFHGEQTFSMEADERVTDLPGNTVLTAAGPLVKTAAVYGHNASGKTNLIAAMEALREVIVVSRKDELFEEVPKMAPFALHRESASEPCRFELDVQIGDDRLRYALEATSAEILSETLHARDHLPELSDDVEWRPVFARSGGQTSLFNVFDEFDSADRTVLHSRVLNERRSFLGFAASFGARRCRQLVEWCESWRVERRYTRPSAVELMKQQAAVASRWAASPDFREELQTRLADADLGITGLLVTEPSENIKRFEERARADLAAGVIPDLDDAAFRDWMQEAKRVLQFKTGERLRLVHRSGDAGPDLPLPWIVESSGTHRFFELLSSLLMLEAGPPHTMVFDEIEESLSPDLVERLVRLFHDPAINRSGSQLIFTTHERSLLDAANLLRHDQVWFVEKKPGGDSELYPLADFEDGPLGPEVLLSKRYAAGPYGAVGRFGPAMEAATPEEPQDLRRAAEPADEGVDDAEKS